MKKKLKHSILFYMDTLNLRKATIEDCDTLFQWTNDPVTRKQSFSTDPIPYDTHVEWLTKKLANADSYLYILEVEGEPSGTVRVDSDKDIGIISFSVAPQKRGHGLGIALLSMVKDAVLRDAPNVAILKGEVKFDNFSSQKCFEYLGYAKNETDSYIEYTLSIK